MANNGMIRYRGKYKIIETVLSNKTRFWYITDLIKATVTYIPFYDSNDFDMSRTDFIKGFLDIDE
jgi:hypothetical protein